ncbi:M67 family metallopeptidase [Yunchengibacter salinarum]|uniref:M67 family metallopeptidase n=1 Tax=Yunchengibacter salinarum TaxID=3133399 RepID=UPI0035B594F7
MTAPVLLLPGGVAALLAAKAAGAAPHEACGLVLGRAPGDAPGKVTEIAFSDNVTAGDPATRFEIDPALHLALQRRARAGGPDLIGVWHSHPAGALRLSEQDRARSVMPGWVWLLSAPDGQGAWHHAAWLAELDGQGFQPLDLRPVAPDQNGI